MDAAPRFRRLFYGQKLNNVGIPFLCGVFLFLLLPLPLVFAVLCLTAGVLLCLCFLKWKREVRTGLLLALTGIALALILMGVETARENRNLSYHKRTVTAKGTVTALVDGGFDWKVKGEVSGKIRVYSEEEVLVGEVLSGKVLLSAQCSEAARREGVDWITETDDAFSLEGKDLFYSFIGFVRSSAASCFGEDREGGFFSSVLLGDREHLREEDRRALSVTSSSHLLAISGLHVSLVLGLVYRLMRTFAVPLRLRGVIVLPVAFLMLFLTGASVSVFRASLMAAFPVFASLFLRRSDSVTAWVFSASLLALWEPQALLTASCLLSFSCTLGILIAAGPLSEGLYWYVMERDRKKKGRVLRLRLTNYLSSFLVASCVFVFQFPIQLLVFGTADALSPLYSLILIPLFSPCVLLGLIALILSPIPFLGPFLMWVARLVAGWFLSFSSFLSWGSAGEVTFGGFAPPLAWILLGILGALIITQRKIHVVFYLHLLIFLLCLFFSFF